MNPKFLPLKFMLKHTFIFLCFVAASATTLLATPVITIIGDNPLYHDVNTPYTDLGATAVDGNGNNITASITVQIGVKEDIFGNYEVNYSVTDGQGGTATVKRIVIVTDRYAPLLSGQTNVRVCLNDNNFVEPPVSATDNYFPTVNVQRTGSFNVSVAGQYNITYTATDGAGNSSVFVRVITVVDCTQTTGVQEIKASQVSVFPNPNNGNFEVVFAGEQCGQLTITDIQGLTVRSFEVATINNGRVSINLSELPMGMYFANFHNATVKISIVK